MQFINSKQFNLLWLIKSLGFSSLTYYRRVKNPKAYSLSDEKHLISSEPFKKGKVKLVTLHSATLHPPPYSIYKGEGSWAKLTLKGCEASFVFAISKNKGCERSGACAVQGDCGCRARPAGKRSIASLTTLTFGAMGPPSQPLPFILNKEGQLRGNLFIY
jgi:hypothetical protein